ncbi:hypothetical protein HG530_005120 [Fusarium avenaceum]|nr:hypothetical protein HG530_005120 [Fusarium avenaceum]
MTVSIIVVHSNVEGGHPVLDHPDDKSSLPGFDTGVFKLVKLVEIIDDGLANISLIDAILFRIFEAFSDDNGKFTTGIQIRPYLSDLRRDLLRL